jgi:hypothetical protein
VLDASSSRGIRGRDGERKERGEKESEDDI